MKSLTRKSIRSQLAAIATTIAVLSCGSDVRSQSENALDAPVRTLAGTGAAGIGDGKALDATFIAPTAIAYERDGSLLIADAGAQRIRLLSRSGVVSSIAGSGTPTLFGLGVGGGYLDGPADIARFDLPSGIAVAPTGDIYVADTGNNCIRRISHGMVSTFAGHPSEDAIRDGSASEATFHAPRELSFDRSGNLYVADAGVGVRVIDPGGNVKTIAFADSSQTTAAVVEDDGNRRILFASTPSALITYDVNAGTLLHATKFLTNFLTEQGIDGHEFTSPAASIWPLGPHEIVYASDVLSSITYIAFDADYGQVYIREFGARVALNAQREGGAFADSPARFAQPMGIAANGGGEIAVADTGNRRIRTIGTFDRRNFDSNPIDPPDDPDAHAFRLALVGTSQIWYDTDWAHSIEAVVATEVERSPGFRRTGKRLEVLPLRKNRLYLDLELDYVNNEIAPRPIDAIATCFFAPQGQYGTRSGERRLLKPMTDAEIGEFAKIQQSVSAAHRYAFAVYFPLGGNIVGENSYLAFEDGLHVLPHDPQAMAEYHASVVDRFHSKNIELVDVWPAFAEYLSKPDHEPIASAWDVHYTNIGTALIGHAIAQRLIAHEAWDH